MKDSTALDPDALLAMLLGGNPVRANGHSLHYEAELEITWYTNAYGVDGVFCKVPTIADVRRFVDDMAQGKDYGPVG